jgi:hypothetical protein
VAGQATADGIDQAHASSRATPHHCTVDGWRLATKRGGAVAWPYADLARRVLVKARSLRFAVCLMKWHPRLLQGVQNGYRSKTESIARLVDDILKDHVALPEFQRDFVWDVEKTFDLFRFLCEGYLHRITYLRNAEL